MKKLYYQDLNSKSNNTILLIHGLGVNSNSWKFQTEALIKENYRVIAVDLEGCGLSQPASNHISIEKSVSDIDSVINSLGIVSFSIIGLSLGGIISLKYASLFPQKVQKLIIINSLAKLQKESFSANSYIILRLLIAYLLPIHIQSKIIAKLLFPKRKDLRKEFSMEMNQTNIKAYRQYLKIITKIDIISDLKNITANTLILTSKQDSVIPNKYSESLKTYIKNSQITYMNGSHAVTTDHPDQANEIITKFLQ